MKRWTGIVLVVAFSGCISVPGLDGDGHSERVWRSFEATYDFTMASSDGVVDVQGAMLLRLSGPETIADRDGELRPAYSLESRHVTWPAGGMPKSPDQAARVVYRLDGSMLLVRVDCPDGVPTELYECGTGRTLDWTVKGSPAPFGLFWGDTVRYHVDGGWDEFDSDLGDRHGMPPGHLIPYTMYRLGPIEFIPGPMGVPGSIDFIQRFEGITQTTHYRLASLDRGELLPPIEPWPMPEADIIDQLHGRFLPGETDEAFAMGLSFQEGFEQLLNESPEANEAMQRSCGTKGIVYWGGGAKPPNVAAETIWGNGDSIAFQLKTIERSHLHQWEWRYQAQPPLLVVLGNELQGQTKDQGEQDAAICPARPSQPVLAVNDFLRAAWQLGLSGAPCELFYDSYAFIETGSVDRTSAGLRFQAFLNQPVSNFPWDHVTEMPVGMISFNAEDGRLDWLSAPTADLEALDAGTLQGRELPSEPRGVLRTHDFRCVPPNYTEPISSG